MSILVRKVASVAVAVATIASLSGIAAAQSLSSADVAAILAQIAALQAKLGAVQATAPSSYTFSVNLTLGSKGADVTALQNVLISGGYLKISAPTGYFGPMTKAALAAWQSANGITPAVGYFGPKSRAAMATAPSPIPVPGPVPVPVGTDLMVELASDNPASRTLGSGTAFNPALKVKLTAGSKNVKVSSLSVMKSGFLANSNLNGVDVVDSKGMRHGNVVTSVNADNSVLITMSMDPVMVGAGSTEYLTVRFNLLTGNYNGTVAFGLNSVSAVGADTTAVSGAFPLNGNAMNIVNGGTSLASTTLDVLTSTGSSSLNVDPNSVQEITKFRIQEVGSNEGIYLHSLTLYMYNTASDRDIKDITLEAQDGTVLATAQPSSKNIVFNLTSPYFIDKGLTKDFAVRAKVVDGTSRKIEFVVYNNYDIDIRGASTGVSVIPGVGSNDTSFPIGNGFNIHTINSGSVTFTRASDSPSASVVPGSTNVVLAKFNAKPTGENMELRQISFGITQVTTALTGTVYVKVNGVTVYSAAASGFATAGTVQTITLSSYPILTSGQDSVISVEGSVNSSAASTATYTVNAFDLLQVKRLITNDLTDPSVGTVSGLTVGVQAAKLAVTTLSTPVANSVVAGTNGYEYATLQLNAQSGGEDVKVTKIIVTHTGPTVGDVGNLYLYKDNDTSPLPTTGSTATNAVTVTFDFTTPIVVTRVAPVTLHLKADALSGTTTSTFNIASSSGNIVATGISTGNSLTHGTNITFAGTGQMMTHVASGKLNLALVSGSGASPSQKQVVSVGTANGVYFAWKMTSQFETQKITSLKITATGAGALATTTLSNIRLYEGSTQVAQASQFDACTATVCTITFTATDNLLSAPVPVTGVTMSVKADVSNGGVAILANDYVFSIAATTDIAVKGNTTATTTATITGTPTASGITYVTSQNVVISAVSPLTAVDIGTGSGNTVGIFKVTNNGSAPVYLATSTFVFANGGTASSSTTFKIYASAMGGGQSDTSAWSSGSGYAANTGTFGASSTIPFDTAVVTPTEAKLDGGSWRYLTIKTSAAAANNNTFQLSVSALGNVIYYALESDLGYSGNADSDLSDTTSNMYVDGTPSLGTVTAKT
ncbi:MAG: peptidoglycan-binding domain-containing protein [Patescibacteria group bacterium]